MTTNVLKEEYDSNGNVIVFETYDGHKEYNSYDKDGKLIKSDITYPNGIREVEYYGKLN